MATRVQASRAALRDGLVAAGTPGTWDHIVEQQGMFSYTGLTAAQCNALVEQHHIYLPDNGRIRCAPLRAVSMRPPRARRRQVADALPAVPSHSMAGINTNNCAYVVNCFDQVVREYPK